MKPITKIEIFVLYCKDYIKHKKEIFLYILLQKNLTLSRKSVDRDLLVSGGIQNPSLWRSIFLKKT